MMKPGIYYHPVVLADIEFVLLAGSLEICGLQYFPHIAAQAVAELFLELVTQMTHIEYDACSYAVLQWYLIQGITVALTVYFFFMENMVWGIHVCAGV